jgi:hypothetical protein
MERLSIRNEMREFDLKNREFYSSLTDEERKKFSNYLMIRWGSAVRGSRELQEFYVIATNERLNKHFFAVNRHPGLQWLMATSVSPGLGAHDHVWIAPKKKESGANEVKKMLLDLYPTMKISDIETLAGTVDKKALKEYLREHGNPD